LKSAPLSGHGPHIGQFLVDTHVHLHPCFTLGGFLDAAHANFRRHAGSASVGGVSSGVLVLTEGASERNFARLEEGTLADESGRWTLAPAGDGISIAAVGPAGQSLLLLAGRQIATRERLEVLLLGSRSDAPDGGSFPDVLAAAAAGSGVVAVPWGFGKWWRARGKVVRAGLEATSPSSVFLSDNGGRPRSLALPSLMRWALDRGHGLLSGSDPLPLPWQVARVGSYGNVFTGAVSSNAPGRDVVKLMGSARGSVRTFGARDTLGRFVRAQIGIRARP
jgi:hypothetical protein